MLKNKNDREWGKVLQRSRAMMRLAEFAHDNAERIAPYISRCEELKAFERTRLMTPFAFLPYDDCPLEEFTYPY